MPEKVVVIVPTYNEELYLKKLLPSLRKLNGWKSGNRQFEIMDVLVVNDGSIDQTGALARLNGVRVLSLGRNYGKAFAFYKGAEAAKKAGATVLVTLDADLEPVKPEQIEALVRPLENKECDMAIGWHMHDAASLSGQRAIRSSALRPLFATSQNGFNILEFTTVERQNGLDLDWNRHLIGALPDDR